MTDEDVEMWFKHEVLPLEGQLRRYLERRLVSPNDVRDRLHDVYERAIIGARRGLPAHAAGYLFTIARNLLVTRARRARIVSFDLVADLDADLPAMEATRDCLTPERHSIARQQLQRAIDGMDRLPPRCREAVQLRKLEGLGIKEIALRQGVSSAAVERQLTLGMRALTDFMLGGTGRIDRSSGEHPARQVIETNG